MAQAMLSAKHRVERGVFSIIFKVLIMLEVVVSVLVVVAIAAWAGLFGIFKSFQKSNGTPQSTAEKLQVPEDSVLRRHFLTHLQSEIEASLFPRPSDSVLQRHYDSLVAAELDNRLAR
jgi:hypothetical protein